MKNRFLHILRNQPLFLALLPVFFVGHGYLENYGLVPPGIALILLGTYLAATLVLLLLAWAGYRNLNKAAMLVFCMMAFHFFFGAAHDLLKKFFPDLFFTRYSFILPFTLLLFILLLIFLKRKKQPFTRSVYFINVLLCLLILYDTGGYLVKKTGNGTPLHTTRPGDFHPCPGCKHPDVFLIIADGYPGYTILKDYFRYDNSSFETGLKKRGFHIIDSSRSNYNLTPFSMASMLNMDYLHGIEGKYSNKGDMALCFELIKKSRAADYFREMGYEVVNYSIFDMELQPSMAIGTFLPRKAEPITNQTFLSRLENEVGYHLATTFKIKFVLEYLKNHDLKNNIKLSGALRKITTKKNEGPRFVYTHLILPHYPYYFDSTGAERAAELLTYANARDTASFISYLKYVNRELTGLVDHIRTSNPTPPVIILMSDHGFREFNNPSWDPQQFTNLNSIYLPDSNYTGFYKGMTNVNQFRVLFNTEFGQRLPLLRDSTSFLTD